jgi:uncharacterized protein YkwD
MKKLLIALIAFLTTFGATLAQGEGPADETRMTLRAEFLRLINRDRAKFGLMPVELDAQASVIADSYCRTQIRNGTTGHFTTDGVAPYMRYSFAGGNDGVSENAASWSANYAFTDATLYDLVRRSEAAMMAETAPHDGHRRTILDPAATHVGIGLAWERGEFRLTQEFVRRYVAWSRPLPRTARAGERVVCSARAADGYDVDAITVHHEDAPQPLSARVANTIETYKLPETRREYLPRLTGTRHLGSGLWVHDEYANGGTGDFQVYRDGSFAFGVPLSDGPGVYTVVVWVRAHGSTGEAIPASNVSIRVDGDAARSMAMNGTR